MSEQVSHPAFTVVGISARANNAREMSGAGIIAGMWQRWMSEQMLERIPNRIDDTVLALYTNYESGADGDYDFLIGAKVDSPEVPDGMTTVTVPASQYRIFETEEGEPWQTVPETWKKIWNDPPADRTFATDFEVYNAHPADPQCQVVEVWVGVE